MKSIELWIAFLLCAIILAVAIPNCSGPTRHEVTLPESGNSSAWADLEIDPAGYKTRYTVFALPTGERFLVVARQTGTACAQIMPVKP